MQSDMTNWSYSQQAEYESISTLPSCYTDPESIDAWRHDRMLSTILPLIHSFPNATWLTIGDGKYGSDAFFLQKHGVEVTASSITDSTLKIAQQRGYIKNYKVENAEYISAPDNSYDFVLCKESYHHFPRPPIAYYEMLRVASKAVILIEPIEDKARIFDYFKKIAKKALRGDTNFSFEPSGNFIYRANIHEMEKMLTALNGSFVAAKKFNDFYHPKGAKYKNRGFSLGAVTTKTGIFIQDLCCRLGLMNYGLGVIITAKTPITPQLALELQQCGFETTLLPQNPYLQDR